MTNNEQEKNEIEKLNDRIETIVLNVYLKLREILELENSEKLIYKLNWNERNRMK